MEVGGEEHAGRRQSEANGAESETFLFTEIIRHGSRSSAADGATDEGGFRGPSCAWPVKMKELGQVGNGHGGHNVFLTGKQAPQRRGAGRNEGWGARMGFDG